MRRIRLIRQIRLRTWIALGIILIILPIILIGLYRPTKTEAEWWNDNWMYRQVLTVANGSDDAATDVPYNVELDTSTLITNGKLQSDGDDIRIVNNNGNIVRHQVEQSTLNTTTTNIWFEATVPANGSSKYYFYYGNPSAAEEIFNSDVESEASDGTTVEMNDGSGYTTSTSYGRITDIRKDGTNLGVNGTYRHSTSYPGNWWNDRVFARTLLATGPLFVEVKFEDTSYGDYSSFGTTINMFDNGFIHNRTYMTYNTSGTEEFYYYLNYDNSTRNSVWVNGSGTLVNQVSNSGALYEADLDESWFGQRWTASGNYGGNTVTKDGSEWEYGATYGEANYYSTNYSYSEAYVDTDFREYRYGTFAGSGTVTEMEIKGGVYGAQTVTLGSEEITPGPVGWWKFDEGVDGTCGTNTDACDSTSTDSDLLKSGATWIAEDLCVFGKCIEYDGTQDYLCTDTNDDATCDDDGNFDFVAADDFTVEAWIRHGTASAQEVILSKYEGTGADGGYVLRMESDGDLTFGVDDANGGFADDTATSTAATYDDNAWHHVVGVKDGTTSIKLYIDGVEIASDSTIGSTGTLANDDELTIGILSDETSNDFDGFIDEVKIYPYARSAAEIKVDYAGGTVVLRDKIQKEFLSDGLVGYWKLDESSGNASDSSGNGTTLTNTGTATFSAAKFGKGAELNGTSQYFDAVDNTNLSVTGNLTLAAWIKPDDITGSQDILGKLDDADESYMLALEGGEVRMYVDSSSNYEETSGTPIAANTLVHVAGVYNANDQTVKLFVNGELEASSTTGTIPSSIGDDAGEFSIGVEDTGGTPANYFDGHIDDVRVYNRTLSPYEVRALYNWGPGPVGYWPMDENTGTSTTYDKSGNELNLTMNGSMTNDDWIPGKYGSALDLDGSDDFLNCTDANCGGTTKLDVGSRDWTVEAWIKTSDTDINASIIGKGASADYSWELHLNTPTANKATFSLYQSAGAAHLRTTSTSDINNDSWHHVAGTYDTATTTVKIYVDGILENSSNSTTGTFDNDTTAEVWTGKRIGTAVFLDGNLDEIKVYDYARTPEQIIEDMNAGHPLPGSPLGSPVGHWKMDEVYGTTAQDTSVNNNDLTLSAASWTTSGKLNGAFDGADNTRLSKADDADFDFAAADGFSVTGWFNRSTISAAEYLVYKENGNEGYTVYVDASGDVIFGIGDTSSSSFPEESIGNLGTDYDDSSWHHFAAVKNGTTGIYLYVDGAEIASDTTLAVAATLENAGVLYVGDANATDGTDEFLGDIDEIKIYRAALTADQVKIDMNYGSVLAYSTGQDEAADMSDGAGNPPVAYWSFDENVHGDALTLYDRSGNTNNVTTDDGAGNTGVDCGYPGVYGSACDLDGDDHLDFVADAPDLKVPSKTISFWAYPDSALTGYTDGISNGDGNWYVSFHSSNRLLASWKNTSGTQKTSYSNTNAVTPGEWHHYAVSFDVDGSNVEIKHYVDSVLNDTDNETDGYYSTYGTNWRIGAWTGTGSFFDGKFDEFKVYNYTRTPAQIAYDYNRGRPVGHWKLDECEGTTVYDSSTDGNGDSNGNTGTWSGATGGNTSAGTCSSGGGDEAWDNGTTGKRNASLDFDGTDDIVTVTNADEIDQNVALVSGVTFSTWIYANSDGESDTGEIFSKNTNTWCRTDSESGGKLDLQCSLDLSTDATLNVSSALSINTWHHIALGWTDDGDDELTLWVDGVNVGSSSDGSGAPSADTANLVIGGTPNFDGQIDDFRVYNYELSAAQIKKVMNEGAVRFGPSSGSP